MWDMGRMKRTRIFVYLLSSLKCQLKVLFSVFTRQLGEIKSLTKLCKSQKCNSLNLLGERNDESKHKMLNHLTRNLWSFQFWQSEKYFYEKLSKMKKFSHHTLLFYTDTKWELLPSAETCRSCSSPQLVSRSQAPTQPQHEWPFLHACCF